MSTINLIYPRVWSKSGEALAVKLIKLGVNTVINQDQNRYKDVVIGLSKEASGAERKSIELLVDKRAFFLFMIKSGYEEYIPKLLIRNDSGAVIKDTLDYDRKGYIVHEYANGERGSGVRYVENFEENRNKLITQYVNYTHEIRVILARSTDGVYTTSYYKLPFINDQHFIRNKSTGYEIIRLTDAMDRSHDIHQAFYNSISKAKDVLLEVFDKINLPLVGFDVRFSRDGRFKILEANACPAISDKEEVLVRLSESLAKQL